MNQDPVDESDPDDPLPTITEINLDKDRPSITDEVESGDSGESTSTDKEENLEQMLREQQETQQDIFGRIISNSEG